jgi:flagellar hook-basal body complex protein FliE
MAVGALGGPVASALQAYRTAQSAGEPSAAGLLGADAGAGTGDFGSMVQSALQGVVQQSSAAEGLSMKAISGEANIQDVVSAVSQAELSLQTTLAVRDKVVAAYQEIMRMAI